VISFNVGTPPDIDLEFFKDNASSNRDALLQLKGHNSLGDGVDVIYIYSLVDDEISYPNCKGKVIYIGEAGRKEKTGTRFSQHISTSETTGGDTGTNYTISRYYWLGKKLRLRVYVLDSTNNDVLRKSIELQLFQQHMKLFGALPIAQGASGGNYGVSLINKLSIPKELQSLLR